MTTQFQFTPHGVKLANKALTKFLRWLNDQDPGMVYTSGLDRTPRRGLIHFNIAINGKLPSLKRMKAKWLKLTGCHDIKSKPAHSNVGYYLAKRASELPNTKDDAPPAWRGITKRFRRIRASEGLYPAPPKKKREHESPWVPCFVGDEQYEEMFNSTVADTALPREAGDTADQPTLTGVVHGHEGGRRQGVLVQDVRIRNHRRGTAGDSREPDALRPLGRRAREGAGPRPELEDAFQ